MKTSADKSPETNTRSTANNVSQARADSRFDDFRSEVTAQRKMQSLADGSEQVAQLMHFQQMANERPDVGFTASSLAEGSQHSIQRKENKTGLPDGLKSGVESLSGFSMDDVKVHYNSSKPAQLQAHAYAQGTNIHIAPGQEKHLPHESWHVVQQKQGRVNTTRQQGGFDINDNPSLENEADIMGYKALQCAEPNTQHCSLSRKSSPTSASVVMRMEIKHKGNTLTQIEWAKLVDEATLKKLQEVTNFEIAGAIQQEYTAVVETIVKKMESMPGTVDLDADKPLFDSILNQTIIGTFEEFASLYESMHQKMGDQQIIAEELSVPGKSTDNLRQTTLGIVPGKNQAPTLGVPFFQHKHQAEKTLKKLPGGSDSKKVFKETWREEQTRYQSGYGGSGQDEMLSTVTAAYIYQDMQDAGCSKEEVEQAVQLLSQPRIETAKLVYVTDDPKRPLSGHPGALSKDQSDMRQGLTKGHGSRDRARAKAVRQVWDANKGINCVNWRRAIDLAIVKAMAETHEHFMASKDELMAADTSKSVDSFSSVHGGITNQGAKTESFSKLANYVEQSRDQLCWDIAYECFHREVEPKNAGIDPGLLGEVVAKFKCLIAANGNRFIAIQYYSGM